MRAQDVTRRLTGFSTPIGGVSWSASEPESAAARRVIIFLEDRRVLYHPHELEIPEHCVRSVYNIRERITHELGALNDHSELALKLKAIRAACRKFLDKVEKEPRIVTFGMQHGHYASWTFLPAIGELRSEIGMQAAFIASAFKIDVEDDLASIFPPSVDDD
jgi:hypothetical protein